MKKIYFKRLLSLLVVVMLVFPTMIFASGTGEMKIKSIYFEDEDGKMVFVDYEKAIQNVADGDNSLYVAIKEYVGIAELKGRKLYVETNDGILLDYAMAMKDNKFKLQDIIKSGKYVTTEKIEASYELKLVDGVVKIIKREDPVKPDPEPVTIEIINGVEGITVEIGTNKDKAISLLDSTTTILDSDGETHRVDLKWTIKDYNNEVEGEYSAVGKFKLSKGMENPKKLKLNVKAMVTVDKPAVEDWPKEILEVFVGESQITGRSYANIIIKGEYIELVKGIYLDSNLGNQIEDTPSQWRMVVENRTIAEDLKGRIRVESEDEGNEGDEDKEIQIEFKKDSLLGEGFGLGNILLEEEVKEQYPNATQYAVRYSVGSDEGTVLLSDKVNLGEYSSDLVQYIDGVNVVNIELYDINGDYIILLKDIVRK